MWVFSFGVVMHEVISGQRPSHRRPLEPLRRESPSFHAAHPMQQSAQDFMLGKVHARGNSIKLHFFSSMMQDVRLVS